MSEPAELRQPSTPEMALEGLSLYLPPARDADRVQLRRVGAMLYTPSMLPRWGEEIRHVGAVDEDIPVRQAANAAKLCVHNMVAVVRAELGSLDRVAQVMQINVLVRCTPGFENPGRVADGASEALYQIFGANGRHHRTVLPTAELPHDAVVQVSGILRTH